MEITDKQKKYLRGLAHDLKPIVSIGAKGVSASLIAELNQNLDHHELLKVKLNVGDREARNAAIGDIVKRSAAQLVGQIGNVAILYRPRREKPVIVLP